ncbi:hypothetical protein BXZ70DRAFT_320991 [Cristinia sonorae]|uniref:Uncharacterized protein n=1 Tax=Cristinia sonorae TaxID=1940300 RepID=A0A8K0UKL2_9AGAR|nr:hypothetical protein BXZ70DRAFT_320991 [Cristinia sonorae]
MPIPVTLDTAAAASRGSVTVPPTSSPSLPAHSAQTTFTFDRYVYSTSLPIVPGSGAGATQTKTIVVGPTAFEGMRVTVPPGTQECLIQVQVSRQLSVAQAVGIGAGLAAMMLAIVVWVTVVHWRLARLMSRSSSSGDDASSKSCSRLPVRWSNAGWRRTAVPYPAYPARWSRHSVFPDTESSPSHSPSSRPLSTTTIVLDSLSRTSDVHAVEGDEDEDDKPSLSDATPPEGDSPPPSYPASCRVSAVPKSENGRPSSLVVPRLNLEALGMARMVPSPSSSFRSPMSPRALPAIPVPRPAVVHGPPAYRPSLHN